MHEPLLRGWHLTEVRVRAVAAFTPPASSRLLCEFILPSAFDAERGTYIPLTHKVTLFPGIVAYRAKRTAKKFRHIGAEILQTPLNPCLFANGLRVPEAFGTPFFDSRSAPPPKATATNIGFVVATLEIDCETRDELEGVLAQIPFDHDCDIETFALHALDLSLSEVAEYRGCCIVFSGRRSVHFHFVFCTRHLRNAPFDAAAERRCSAESEDESRLMHAVHRTYWDHTAARFSRFFPVAVRPDPALRTITQYRRLPWGMRKLDQPAELLDLDVGDRVIQLVLFERLRAGSGAGSDYLVPPDFGRFE
jgi:hypothetical protein